MNDKLAAGTAVEDSNIEDEKLELVELGSASRDTKRPVADNAVDNHTDPEPHLLT